MGLRNVARLREQQGHGVLGGGDDVRLRGVDDHHPARGGSGNVDVVEADPRATNHHQIRTRGEHLVVDLRGGADDERGCASNRFEKARVIETLTHVDIVPVGPEAVEPAIRDRLGHQNARHSRIVIRLADCYQPERRLWTRSHAMPTSRCVADSASTRAQ